MLVTLDLPLELEQQLQAQADLQQISLNELVEKLFTQFFNTELTLEEIEARYANEWVAIQETAWNERGEPTKGIVIAHDVDGDMMIEPVRQLHQENPEAKSYVWFVGDAVPEGMVFML